MDKMRGLSESNMVSLYRKAALALFHGKCFFCGADYRSVEIEVHHPTKRNKFLLKYNYRNAIPTCKWPKDEYGMSCHQFAETPNGKKRISDYQEKVGYSDYLQERSGQAKQWFVTHGISRADYLKEMYNELRIKAGATAGNEF
jgi:hypothetical protein